MQIHVFSVLSLLPFSPPGRPQVNTNTDTNTNTNTNMYNKNLSERDLYLAGLVGGWREGAGVKEGSERARPQ